MRIVNEPTAASLAYGIGLDPSQQRTIAVYDLGGGTFDVSILQIQNGIFEVLATNGNTYLGGDDFDRAILNYWLEKNNLDVTVVAQDNILMQTLRLQAEAAKKRYRHKIYIMNRLAKSGALWINKLLSS